MRILSVLLGLALVPLLAPAPAAQAHPGTIDVRVGTYNVCGHGCLPTKAICEATIGRDCATKLPSWAEGRADDVAERVARHHLGVVATQEIGNNPTPTQTGVDVESFRAPLTRAMQRRGYAEAPADYAGTRHPVQGYPLRSGAGRYTYYDAKRYSHRDERGRDLPHDLLWLPDSTPIYGKTMTWNVLRERRTGARFVVVDLHLEYRKNGATDPNGRTKDWDRVRYDDATRTIAHVTRDEPATRGLPVVFAGDMNSASTADGASAVDAFADAGFDDAEAVARRHRHRELASFNGGTVPLPEGGKIDHVFVERGTVVRAWAVVPETRRTSGTAWELLDSDHNLVHADVRLRR
ncbi:endonuclease/exonuclease/phosphatase family protein [Solicola sp. PLA-1-18]|uniref:endonuclease/exonuclease/phosphatase family protein n=1 Tax=Solicola sp. PLA-1-18 TaxID=3380532 RepID=UPI003B7C1FC8